MHGRIARFLRFQRDGQATLVALVLIVGATLLRLVTLWEGPILDPLEAREFQLARILVEQGPEAWIAALQPADMPAIGGAPLVAIAGHLMGFEQVGWLRLPGFFVLVLATFRMFSFGVWMTHRLDPGAVMAAVLFCAPATGLVMLSSTADALALLVFVTLLRAAAQFLRLRGDSWVPAASEDYTARMNRLVVLPDTSERADAVAARRFWLAIGLGTWVAGAAPATMALLAILVPGMILLLDRVSANRGAPLIHIHPNRPEWYLGTLSPEWAPVTILLAAVPQAVVFAGAGGWTPSHLVALLLPRTELAGFAAAPLGWWETAVLAGAAFLIVAPFFLASRRNGASALETLALLTLVVPASIFVAIPGWPLALLLVLLAGAGSIGVPREPACGAVRPRRTGCRPAVRRRDSLGFCGRALLRRFRRSAMAALRSLLRRAIRSEQLHARVRRIAGARRDAASGTLCSGGPRAAGAGAGGAGTGTGRWSWWRRGW